MHFHLNFNELQNRICTFISSIRIFHTEPNLHGSQFSQKHRFIILSAFIWISQSIIQSFTDQTSFHELAELVLVQAYRNGGNLCVHRIAEDYLDSSIADRFHGGHLTFILEQFFEISAIVSTLQLKILIYYLNILILLSISIFFSFQLFPLQFFILIKNYPNIHISIQNWHILIRFFKCLEFNVESPNILRI